MSDYWIIYDAETGVELSRGMGPEGCAAIQVPPQGTALIAIPKAAWDTSPLDLDIVKASMAASVDADAEKVRSIFVTATPGQFATYLEKEAEARRVLAGHTDNLVFLPLEAEAIGAALPALAAEVVAQADAWRSIGARIEAARRKAKCALVAASTLAEIATAIQIDWQAATT